MSNQEISIPELEIFSNTTQLPSSIPLEPGETIADLPKFYVIDALEAGGIDIPATIGNWPGGSGNDPGDLGEDIRAVPVPTGGSKSNTESFHQNTDAFNKLFVTNGL